MIVGRANRRKEPDMSNINYKNLAFEIIDFCMDNRIQLSTLTATLLPIVRSGAVSAG